MTSIRPAFRWLLAFLLSVTLVGTAQVLVTPVSAFRLPATLPDLHGHQWSSCAAGAPKATAIGDRSILVLHDAGGRASDSGAAYATSMANLASHFGRTHVVEARRYRPGELLRYDVTVYVGSRYGEVLPPAFLRDVRAGRRPILWLKENIFQLAPPEEFRRRYGWVWQSFDGPSDYTVSFHGITLHPSDSGDAVTRVAVTDRVRAQVLATAVVGGHSMPWAVRSGSLTYIGDLPLSGIGTSDASLALADILRDVVPRPATAGPDVSDRHRALVRIEDVGPMSSPDDLRAIARSLRSRHLPYSIAVYPVYVGPLTEQPRKVVHLWERPDVVRAIVEMMDGGATLVLHGYTHQFGDRDNPRSGESATDFEFFLAHLNANQDVIYDGPVPGDSAAWAERRVDQALAELSRVGLPRPQTLNVPHYAASAADYRGFATRFPARYDRGQYFASGWDGASPISAYMSEQAMPYVIRDAYGSLVVPENLGYVSDTRAQGGPNTRPDILAGAATLLKVRDSVASFFYHPFLGPEALDDLVDKMRAMGYTFVSPCDL